MNYYLIVDEKTQILLHIGSIPPRIFPSSDIPSKAKRLQWFQILAISAAFYFPFIPQILIVLLIRQLCKWYTAAFTPVDFIIAVPSQRKTKFGIRQSHLNWFKVSRVSFKCSNLSYTLLWNFICLSPNARCSKSKLWSSKI